VIDEMAHAQVEKDDWDSHWTNYADAAHENPAEKMRFRLVVSHLRTEGRQPRRILDIGSGQGDMLSIIALDYPSAEGLGVELSATGVEISKKKVPSASFIQRDLLLPAEVPAAYEGWATEAVCSEVLEHVDDPVLLLRNARAYMAPGCRLVVTVPGGPRSAFDHHIGHRRHFKPRDLNLLLAKAGFTSVETFGAGFPFFNLYRLVVIARGKKLVEDVASQGQSGSMSSSARLLMRTFDFLFKFNLWHTRLGWQTVGVARVPG
jgi:2-polyprenyl-3-methyl-5-hydroxy-6-metoxy-1,4-benzoquinol methylase